MRTLLVKKEVDQSLLTSGLTIPIKIMSDLTSTIGISLKKGEKSPIKIFINQKQHDAVLTYIKFKGSNENREVMQIRYSANSSIALELKAAFSYSASFLPNDNETFGQEKPVYQEYVNIYAIGSNSLEFECFSFSIRDRFFEYLGSPDSLKDYRRSYKLVLYKSLFERMDAKGCASAQLVAAAFRDYYIGRARDGKIPDQDVDRVISDIERSSVKDVYGLIVRQPLKHIQDKGFIVLRQLQGQEDQLCLADSLQLSLTKDDIVNIIQIVDAKLQLYFERMDDMGDNLTRIASRILNDYVGARTQTFAQHPLGEFFRYEVPQLIHETKIVNMQGFKIQGSVGQGNWAAVPWICIFDKRITTSAQKGIYIVYLLSKDGRNLYLTLNQGCTDIKRSNTKTATINILKNRAEELRLRIDNRDFNKDDNISLGDAHNDLALFYEKGCIFYRRYEKGKLPAEVDLRNDLSKMMEIYQKCVTNEKQDREISKTDELQILEERTKAHKEYIDNIKNYISSEGFSYPFGLIENFYLSLKTKPFVILAGISGTGKTRLVKLFAEAIGATTANGRFKLVAVRPDWSDSSDLFGHVDLNGKFLPGVILEFINQAGEDLGNPYFLCLDEMNLARVEYYLSDVLSIMETRDRGANGEIYTDPLLGRNIFGADEGAIEKYHGLRLPENLYIVGTVNMDETTFPFSKKVLDRANTLEFSYVDLNTSLDEGASEVQGPQELQNSFLKTEYLRLSHCDRNDGFIDALCSELEALNKILKTANAQVGYRVRDEIVFYCLNNRTQKLISDEEALDNEILQKVLPRIQGNSASVKRMLCDLFRHCASDFDSLQIENNEVSEKMEERLSKGDARYPNSAHKITFMVRSFEENGFTSFWLQ